MSSRSHSTVAKYAQYQAQTFADSLKVRGADVEGRGFRVTGLEGVWLMREDAGGFDGFLRS